VLSNVITYLNTKITNLGYFNNVICLAERIEREGRIYPAQYASNGEYAEINLDSLGSCCYWRKNGDVTVSEESNTGGIGVQYRTNIPLKFVGFLKKTYADDQYLSDNLISEIISVVTTSNSALKAGLKAKIVRVVADTYSTDRISVGQAEYDNISFEANYQYAYFSIDFNLTFVTNNQCYTDVCNDLPINGYVIIYDGSGDEIARVNCGGSYVCTGGGTCADATVRNSDSSYSTTVASGGTLVLSDESFDVYMDSVLLSSFTYIPLSGDDINITAG